MNHARTHFRFFPSPRGDRNYLPPGPRGEGTPIALSPHDRVPTTHPPRVRGEGYSTISLPPRQCGGGHPRIPFPPRQRGEGRGGGKCGAHFLAAALLLFLAASASAAPDCGEQGISVHCGTGPTVTFDPSGNLWAAFVQNDRIHVARAGAPGEDFGEPVPVIPDPEPIDVNGEDRPKLVFGPGGEIYLAWTRKGGKRYTGDIRFTRSLDGGKTFEAPRTINDDGLVTAHRFPTLFVNELGDVYVAWLDKRDLERARVEGRPYAGAALYYTASADQGVTFAPNRKVADSSCECCRIAASETAEGQMAVFWRHIFEGGFRDHAFAVLGKDGLQGAVQRATEDGWRIDACPHHGGAMAPVGDGTYHLAWFTGGEGRRGIFYGRYEASTGRLYHVKNVTTAASAAHPYVARAGKETLLVWKHFDGEETTVRLATSPDDGRTWTEPRALARTRGASDHPFLLSRDGQAWLAWHTAEEGLRILPVAGGSHGRTASLPVAEGTESTTAALKPFRDDSLAAIERQYAGRPFLLVLWSRDCPICREELPLLGRLKKEHPDAPLVFVATDSPGAEADTAAILASYGLAGADAWAFADPNLERLRYRIDPEWYGELPRTYFYGPDSTRAGKSGRLDIATIRTWLGVD